MLWSEKTTVCRIFSCQRSDGSQTPQPQARLRAGPRPHSAPSQGTSVNVGSVGSPLPRAGALDFPDVGVRETQEPHSLTETFKDPPPRVALRRATSQLNKDRLTCLSAVADSNFSTASCRAVTPQGRRLVENTGLEPVTSWLQTRRSPS